MDKQFLELQRQMYASLFSRAKQKDELSFLFAVLGINSGMEDVGWQPIGETIDLSRDLVALIQTPLEQYTRARLALMLYSHLTEASFLYHCIWNLMLAAEGEPPKMFSFLDLYKNGTPPSVPAKLKAIREKAEALGFKEVGLLLDQLIRTEIRNAFSHSDYILFDDELRLKHRGDQIMKIPLGEVFSLTQRAVHFVEGGLEMLLVARRSFGKDYIIKDRKRSDGMELCSVKVLTDNEGVATGFSTSDPLPLW